MTRKVIILTVSLVIWVTLIVACPLSASAAGCFPPANATWQSSDTSAQHVFGNHGQNYVLSADPFDSRKNGGFTGTMWAGPATTGLWGFCWDSASAFWPYPSVALNFPGAGLKVNGQKSITGAYQVKVPSLRAWHGEVAYDFWLNGHPGDNGAQWLPPYPVEFMVWVDTTPTEGTDNHSFGDYVIAGVKYQLTVDTAPGGRRISMVLAANRASGVVNVLALIRFAEANVHTKALVGRSPVIGQAEFGEEIASTSSADLSFTSHSVVSWSSEGSLPGR